jgi:hypothetical protein
MPDLDMLGNWANIGMVLITILSIVIAAYRNRRARPRRALACEFSRAKPLIYVSASEAAESDIEIRYKGQKTKNAFTVHARLKNIGVEEIRRSDIVEPVTFTFGVGTELLAKPHTIRTYPEDLKFTWNLPRTASGSKRNAVSLDFDLLNQDEELLIEFICIGPRAEPKVGARIVGISTIQLVDLDDLMKQRSSMRYISLVIILGLGTLTAAIILNIPILCQGLVAGFVLAGVVGFLLNNLRMAQVKRNASKRD